MTFLPRLNTGDCIGLFSPSGPIRDQDKVQAGIDILHSVGFKTRRQDSGEYVHEYLAADDQARLNEFHSLWSDPEIKALMAIRGGFGCLRIIDRIDFDLIRRNPKPIIGFSDITVLLNSISARSGLVTIHGPVVSSLVDSDQESIDTLVALLTGETACSMTVPAVQVLRSGNAKGVLRGGNLATLAHMSGTPWQVPASDTILLLEDTGEPMYRIDRMVSQMYQGGMLDSVSGIILGTFDTGDGVDRGEALQNDVWQRVLELTENSACPVWGAFPVGHCQLNRAVPLGAEVRMDGDAKTLKALQSPS